jgi:hypothetical protein
MRTCVPDVQNFMRESVCEKLAAIKVIEYRDADYETAKKEVAAISKCWAKLTPQTPAWTWSLIMNWYARSGMIGSWKVKWKPYSEGL